MKKSTQSSTSISVPMFMVSGLCTVLVIGLISGYSSTAYAGHRRSSQYGQQGSQGYSSDLRGGQQSQQGQQPNQEEARRQFFLGLCVGQALARQSLSIPVPQPGEPPQALDSPTKAALKEAMKSCRAEMDGNNGAAVPSPSGSPSPVPSPLSSALPSA